MRPACVIVLLLSALGLAENGWWQDFFGTVDAPSPPRAEATDPLVVDGTLDQPDNEPGLLWMSLVSGAPANLAAVIAEERALGRTRQDTLEALLTREPVESSEFDDGIWRASERVRLLERDVRALPKLDLDDVRTLVTRYQESQGRRPKGVVIGQTMVMPAVFDAGETVSRWVNRNVLPVLPDMVVEWGRDVGLTRRLSWSFSRQSMSGEPTLLDRHVEESVKQVDFRVGGGMHFEFGLRRELLNNQPEDDLFEGGSGASEPFASLMWRF